MTLFDANAFPPAFVAPLAAVWIWASLLSVGAFFLLAFAVIAIRRAVRSSRELPEDDASGPGLLGITETGGAARGVVAPPPAPVIPVVQTPIIEPPAPEPLIPVESFAQVHADKILETGSLSPDHRRAAALEPEGAVLETDELEESPHRSAAPDAAAVVASAHAPEALIAQQIAREIAERRARLAASADEFGGDASRASDGAPLEIDEADVEDSAASHAARLSSSPSRLTAPAASPVGDVATNALSAKTSPATLKSPFTEQLPSSERKKLAPPVSSVATPAVAPPPVEPVVERVVAETPVVVPLTERFAPVAPPEELIPVEQIPAVTTPMTDPLPAAKTSRRRTDASVPSFLGDGPKPSVTEIGFERNRILVGMGVVGLLFTLTAVIISPLRRKLPVAIAEPLAIIPRKLGLEDAPPPLNPPKQVRVQEYQIGFKPGPKKEVRIVVVSGVVKNISSEKLTDLRAELQLLPRKADISAPETRVIYLTPPNLEPNQEGKYEIEVMDDQYRSTSFKRIVSADGKEIPTETVKELLPTPFPEEKTRPKR
jgi:hypothetical protein